MREPGADSRVKGHELQNYKKIIRESAFFDTILVLAIEIENIIVEIAYLNSPRRKVKSSNLLSTVMGRVARKPEKLCL